MVDFQVEPAVVRAFGVLIGQQADHAADAKEYLDKQATIDESSVSNLSVIATAQAHHPAVLDVVRSAIGRSVTFFTDSGAALGDTADFYESKDEEALAKLDAAYEGAETYDVVNDTDWKGPVGAPSEQTDPSSALKEPSYDKDDFDPTPFGLLSDWNNIFSPAVWVNEFVKETVGYDILKEAQDTFAGDWEAFAKAGAAFHVLAKCYKRLATNTAEFGKLPRYWQGEALDMTYAYFAAATYVLHNNEYVKEEVGCKANGEKEYTDPVYSGYYGLLYVLAEEYFKLAQGMSELANAVSGALGTLFDMCFWAGVAAGVTIGTAEFAIPPIVSGLLGAGMLANAAQQATKITGLLESATFAVNGFTGLSEQGTTMPVVDAIEQLELPKPAWEWAK